MGLAEALSKQLRPLLWPETVGAEVLLICSGVGERGPAQGRRLRWLVARTVADASNQHNDVMGVGGGGRAHRSLLRLRSNVLRQAVEQQAAFELPHVRL